MNAAPLLAPSFLFRFACPCERAKFTRDAFAVALPESARLPAFSGLDERPLFADVRAVWNEQGLLFQASVSGKHEPSWCRATRVEESDGLHLWLATRDSHDIHRASRYCQRFAFLPQGGGRRLDEPVAAHPSINRARELPAPVPANSLRVQCQSRPDGYLLHAFIGTEALTRFDAAEQPRLGFMYAVVDRELGWQTLALGPEFPITEDPSLWGVLELVGAKS